jgi:hypothetical protein
MHHGDNPNLNVVQVDIYDVLPLAPGQIDSVFCFGLLQDTTDVKRAFMWLIPRLKKEGRLAVDVYRKRRGTIFWSKYWIRAIAERLENM